MKKATTTMMTMMMMKEGKSYEDRNTEQKDLAQVECGKSHQPKSWFFMINL
jgi:hypothetical protein